MNNYILNNQRMKQKLIITSMLWIAMMAMFFYSLLVFIEVLPVPSTFSVSWISIGICIMCLCVLKQNQKIATFGLTSVLLIYTIFTQFGLGTIYYILGPEYLSNYGDYTLRFLFSNQYVQAVILGLIAIMTYTIASSLGTIGEESIAKRLRNIQKGNISLEEKYAVWIGYVLLIIVLFYLLFQIATGKISFSMGYSSFRENIVDASSIYHYILIIYSIGIAYIIAAGNDREIKLGIFLYSCSAIIFFLTGNKGEVLYATLACIGASQYRGFKIKPSLILFIVFILFIFIPFVTEARENGVLGSLHKVGFSLTDAFTEIGMQLRLNVYILEQVAFGSREFIDGFSYFNPLVNIIDRLIPFVDLRLTPPADFNFNEIFPGYGFNQVAESYANFGLIGVLMFFFIMGFTISKIESRKMSLLTLAYFTSVVSIFINVTRNSFAFVPGQILILTILYVGVKLFTKRKI